MEIQIRNTGEHSPVCETCGATELVWSGTKPVSADLTRVMEREMLRREIGLARVLKDHLATVVQEQATTEKEMAAQVASERWRLQQEYDETLTEVEQLLSAAKVTGVKAWRVARKRREQNFAARIDGIIAELADRTRLPNTGIPVA